MRARPPRLFGTDGIRGPAGEGVLTAESLVTLGRCLGEALVTRRKRGVPRVLLGRDTRPSGPMVGGALFAGLQQGGAHAEAAGVLPTPAVALLVREEGYDAGLAVTASHNAAADNGFKIMGPDGEKVPANLER
ncbi:MAG: phosphoglucosamine mutase, partial [Planctomycetota bacterium]